MTSLPLASSKLVGWERVPVAGSYADGDPAFQAKLDDLAAWPHPIQAVIMPNGTRTIWHLREPGKWPVETV